MKVLGIESSSLVASVGLVTDGILTAEYTVNYKKTHSQTLLPMLDELCRLVELEMESLDGIAVSAGPGSFTGLRIGSATAKGLGLALNKPLISVPTIDALAYNLWGCSHLVCPMMDARRSQVYTGLYYVEDNLAVQKESCAMNVHALAQILNERGEKVIFLGDGVPVYREELIRELSVPYAFAPAHSSRQRGASVAALGTLYLEEGKWETAAEHRPEYLRKPQAEREREGIVL